MDHATHVTGNFTCEGSELTCMPEERERRSKGEKNGSNVLSVRVHRGWKCQRREKFCVIRAGLKIFTPV